jgi:hypothetical protein
LDGAAEPEDDRLEAVHRRSRGDQSHGRNRRTILSRLRQVKMRIKSQNENDIKSLMIKWQFENILH